MTEFSGIGNLLKKIYRIYSFDILNKMEALGLEGLTFSYLEVFSFICENEGSSLKSIGKSLGLKKQTMTNHISELEKRNLIYRKINENDRRSQIIFLTEHGFSFRRHLLDAIAKVEIEYENIIGQMELERLRKSLENLCERLETKDQLF